MGRRRYNLHVSCPLDGQLSGSKDELMQVALDLRDGRHMPQASSGPQQFIGPPAAVRLGPLTQQLLGGAKWQGADGFPAWQIWADDVEEVLAFLSKENRLQAFVSDVQKVQTPRHRDALLAEARAAFHLAKGGLRILEWEPPGEGATKGDVLVSLDESPAIFVEVKQPGWEGEFLPQRVAEKDRLPSPEKDRILNRIKQGKFVPGLVEGGCVQSPLVSMNVVRRNVLPKLTSTSPNLAVVVDDCMVSPVGIPGLTEYVLQEFAHPSYDPDDPDDVFTYERLGGVLFLRPEAAANGMMDYGVDFVENPNTLPACALPRTVSTLFSQMRDASEQREDQRAIGRLSLSW
jgi:hypothetical protein